MSVSVARKSAQSAQSTQPFQPYQCDVCKIRFTRQENLKRHAARHSRSHDSAHLPCELCPVTFSRPDLRDRHMRRKHPEHEVKRSSARRPRRRATQSPPEAPQTPTDGQPASPILVEAPHLAQPPPPPPPPQPPLGGVFGLEMGGEAWSMALHHHHLQQGPFIDHVLLEAASQAQDLLPPSFAATLDRLSFSPPGLTAPSPQGDVSDDGWRPSSSQVARGCQLFFARVAPFLPFLHESTFDSSRAAEPLVLSMLCLGYQYGNDPDVGEEDGTGLRLSRRCFARVRTVVVAAQRDADRSTTGSDETVALVQTYLLLAIYAMMYLCGDDSAYGLKMHSKTIALLRAGGLMQPADDIGDDDDNNSNNMADGLDALWHRFLRTESRKRTVYAAHQIDALWYQFLSIPRRISHLEIKLDLPCPADYWRARSSAEWAHRQLVNRRPTATTAANHSGPVAYADAVRCFLSSPSAPLDSLPAFDPYGAVNIAHFFMSSAREISGWSTMTGMLSVERFGPLRSSLIALHPFVSSSSFSSSISSASSSSSSSSSSATTSFSECLSLPEATWETAMIELHLWSPSHTGGIVEGSMDAVLRQAANQPPPGDVLCRSADTAAALQRHVDWFLRYLDHPHGAPDAEAPWVTLYAYAAFLLAWRLLCAGVPGAMTVLGLSAGDLHGALHWAKRAFSRRHHGRLSELILEYLDRLEV